MQNLDTIQTAVNYEQHNNWYNSMFGTNIKTEPGTGSPTLEKQHQHQHQHQHQPMQKCLPGTSVLSQLENYLKQQHQHQQQQQHPQQQPSRDTMSAMTPSPSNNEAVHNFFDTQNLTQQLRQQHHYQQHFNQAQQAAAQNQISSTISPLGFNPLTPPGLPSAILPSITHLYQQTHANLRTDNQTPSPPPSLASQTHFTATSMDVSDKLQAALTPRSTPPMDITPPKSPKITSSLPSTSKATAAACAMPRHDKELDAQSNSSEDMKYAPDSEDDESIRMPIYNSHGKMKNYKCKSCGMVAITKVSFWEHARIHMKPEKILQCPKCPFVTELKHHLEYHTRKHKNLKPFQCDKCSYTCVNKSMLNSHRKSHSSVYQYRCANCEYATKYCHSFKLHLRKYNHKPGLVLDDEGKPNPSIVIDVYGTRRGPKSKSSTGSSKRSNNSNANKSSRSNSNSGESSKHKLGYTQQNSDSEPSSCKFAAAMQALSLPVAQQQISSSSTNSISSTSSDLPPTLPMDFKQQQHSSLHQHQQQMQKPHHHQQQQQILEQQQPAQKKSAQDLQCRKAESPKANSVAALLPPLASILQQNQNIAFFPYWNLNLQMLAAQQQAAALTQLPSCVRNADHRQIQKHRSSGMGSDSTHEEEDDYDTDERKSVDSVMDLSQGSPIKEEQEHRKTPDITANLKLQDESNDTPIFSTNSSSRRKGRVLQLDAILQVKSATQSPEQLKELFAACAAHNFKLPIPNVSPLNVHSSSEREEQKSDKADEPMSVVSNTFETNKVNKSANKSKSTGKNADSDLISSLYGCKYCDIYFKDPVLYTMHMGYHSCDDAFKCNMCSDISTSAIDFFVHIARHPHS